MTTEQADLLILDDPSTETTEEERARARRWFHENLTRIGPILVVTTRLHPDDLQGGPRDGRKN